MKKKILSLILTTSLIFNPQDIGCFAEGSTIEGSENKEENNISKVNESLIEEYYKAYNELNNTIMTRIRTLFLTNILGFLIFIDLLLLDCFFWRKNRENANNIKNFIKRTSLSQKAKLAIQWEIKC